MSRVRQNKTTCLSHAKKKPKLPIIAATLNETSLYFIYRLPIRGDKHLKRSRHISQAYCLKHFTHREDGAVKCSSSYSSHPKGSIVWSSYAYCSLCGGLYCFCHVPFVYLFALLVPSKLTSGGWCYLFSV